MRSVLCALAAIIVLAACGANIQNREAVQQGVMEHLKARSDIDLSGMDVEVTAVSFRKGEADATVMFRVKGTAQPEGSMTIAYTLEEKGKKWVVKGRRSTSEGDPHDGGSKAPGALPPGHPATPNLPPGHPPTEPKESKP